MERQIESPSAYPRLFNEESWRDLLPEAVHGPLKAAAAEFFQDAIGTSGDSSQESLRERELSLTFYDGLNSEVVDNLGDTAINLSQVEADYGALFLKLAVTPSGRGRDGLLRDLTLAREKLVRKEERAPVTTAARSLAEKIGWRGAVGKLQPGSSGERLQAIEQVVLQKLGHQDLRSLFESQAETPQQVLGKFIGKRTDEMVDWEEHGLVEGGEEPAMSEAELSKNIFGKISRWLKGVDWKFVGRGSASMLAGVGLSELLGSASWVGGILLGVNMLLRRAGGAERVEGFIKLREAKYPRASEKMGTRVAMGVAMGELKLAQMALKVVESPEAMFVGAGLVVGAGIRQVRELVNATRPVVSVEAQQAVAGGGEGLAEHHSRPVDASIGQAGGLPPDVQPPADVATANEATQAAQAAAQQAEAAEAARQAALEAVTRTVMVNPGDTLTGLIDAAGGNAYGKDFTDTVLQSADVLTGAQNPNRDMASALIDFIKAHPGGVNWRDAINGVGDLAKQTVGGLPLKDAIAQATRMIYPGQEMKVVVGAMP